MNDGTLDNGNVEKAEKETGTRFKRHITRGGGRRSGAQTLARDTSRRAHAWHPDATSSAQVGGARESNALRASCHFLEKKKGYSRRKRMVLTAISEDRVKLNHRKIVREKILRALLGQWKMEVRAEERAAMLVAGFQMTTLRHPVLGTG